MAPFSYPLLTDPAGFYIFIRYNSNISLTCGQMFVTNREQEILAILRNDPMIPQQELAEKLGISRSAVAGHIMNLTQKGHIKGKGYILNQDQTAVVIGGANMDLAGISDAPLVAGDSNPGSLQSSPGGVGRNIADNLSRMGSRVEFVSCIGQDSWGEQLLKSCRDAGIGTEHLMKSDSGRTATYLSIHDMDGEMKLAMNDMAVLNELDSAQLAKRKTLFSFADLLVLDANLSEEALSYLFNCTGSSKIFVDPVSAAKAVKLLPYLDRISLLKPNLMEAELLSGIKAHSKQDLPNIADSLHQKGVDSVLISLGADGIFASDQGNIVELNMKSGQVANVTGAGDAMMAGISHACLKGWDWQRGVRFASAAACLAVQSSTTINPLMSEMAVRRLLENEHA